MSRPDRSDWERHWAARDEIERLERAEAMGCEAREADWAETSNPFDVVRDSARFQAWQRGWLAQDEVMADLPGDFD